MGHTIGIFDSGVGGLTVVKELAKQGFDSFVYFGDTARCPYGPKSDKTIIRYSIENGIFLLEQGIDLLIVACNTATALALPRLEKTFRIPVLGVIEPAVELAIKKSENGRIGIIGTRATISSGAYQKALQKKNKDVEVCAAACPLFVPLIEEQYAQHDFMRAIIKEHLAPLQDKNIDTLILGCTHYPLIEELIQEEMGPYVHIVNPAVACAEAVRKLQKEHATPYTPSAQFFVSDDPERFRRVGEHFFGKELPQIHLVPTMHT